ncbi:hypothetical protein E2C01_040488 [Portunus trituberculatus]|uniref:Uncharacterized protein n=1 Tax=Portunus trituberculatus TaxID=210409 RepID=A0A5B7FJU5_PORTR|nr:hypothetical protein [Portunus trituberculatus]
MSEPSGHNVFTDCFLRVIPPRLGWDILVTQSVPCLDSHYYVPSREFPWPGLPKPPHRQTLIDSTRLKLSQKTRSSAKSTRVVEGDSKILEPPETSITNWIELSCQGWKSVSGFLSVRWSDK